jgi:exosortase A
MAAIWWRSETYAHGMLIPLISLWLIIRKRSQLTMLDMGPDWPALIPLSGLCLAWLLGLAADVLVVEQMASTLILIALVIVTLGRTLAWALAFPLAYLIFAVPFGEELTPFLQQITADITVKALQLSGIPVYISGLFIEIPTGRFEVAEACSGIRYLIASFALGTLYAHLTYHRLRSRLVFIAASLLVPVLANGLRAYMIVLIAHLSEMKYATGVDHLIYGWLFFGIVMLLMFWIGSWWRDPEPALNPGQEGRPLSRLPEARPRYLGYAAPAAALVILSLTYYGSQLVKQTPQASPLPLQLFSFPPWVRQPAEALNWQPDFVGADRTFNASYRLGGQPAIGLYIADYQSEHQGKELINNLNRWYSANAWTPAGRSTRTVPVGSGQLEVNVLELRALDGTSRRLWYWYQVYQQPVANPLQVKLLQALNKLSGAHGVASVYALAVDYEDSRSADAALTRFLEDNWPHLVATAP